MRIPAILAVWVLACFCCRPLAAQEFPKEFISHISVGSGMQTRFDTSPDLYFADLRIVPQFTLLPGRLRGGLAAGAFFGDKKLGVLGGPTASVLLKSFTAGVMGTAGNLHLTVQHLWGSQDRRLAGGGLGLDLGNKLILGLQSYRDYRANNWIFQTALGIRVSRVQKPVETFNQ